MNNNVDPPRAFRPQLGATVEEVMKRWKEMAERHPHLIRAFIVGGPRAFSWHDGSMVRVLNARVRSATAEEVSDVRRAVQLGIFLVLQYTDEGPKVLHQAGEALPDTFPVPTAIARHLPARYLALLSLPVPLRRLCLWAIVRCVPKGYRARSLSPEAHSARHMFLTNLVISLLVAALTGAICSLRTHDSTASWLLAEATLLITMILLHRLRTGTFGTRQGAHPGNFREGREIAS